MGNTVQLLKDGQPVFPVTDVSLVMGLQDAIKLPPVKVATLPTASADTAGKMYYVGPDGNDEYERYITSAVGGSYSWIDLGDTSIPLPSIADNLTTADANTALSANQGVVLAGQIGQLDQIVDLLGTTSGVSGTIDLSQYTQYDKVISGSSIWEAAAVPNCYSRIIPVTPGKYKITAGSTQSIIAFLSAMPVDNQAVSYGTVNGAPTSSRTSITAGASQEFTILDTDTSIYLCVRDDLSTVLKPTVVYTAKTELFVPLNSEFAVVTEATDNLVKLQDATISLNSMTVEISQFGNIKIKGTASSSGGRTTKLCSPFSLPAGSYRLVFSATPSADVFVETLSGDTIIAQASAPAFSLNAATAVYIGANVVSGRTYSDDFGIAIYANQNKAGYVPTITAKDSTARKQIEDLVAEGNMTENGVTLTTLSLSETSDKFIGYDGYVASSNGFAYTEKFYVEKGKQIFVRARGYSTNVAMIAKVVTENSKYDPVVVSTDSLVHDYNYIVNEAGYFAASYSKAQPYSIIVADNTPATLSAKIDQLSDGTDDISKDLYFGVPTIGIIGDSLACGVGYNPKTSSVQEYISYAWWKVMERRSGRTFRRFCEGGMSTRSFLTNSTYGLPVALTSGNECKLYIFALEINDRTGQGLGPSYLGTSADIDLSDPDNNADTYYGNYARIIQKITAFNPGCKFMLFTNPRTDGDFNDAIRTIAEMFDNCYLVDLWELYSQYYTSGGFFDQFKDQSSHYPGMAYQAMAKLLEKAIDKCIGDNKSAFDEIQY